MNRLCFDTTNGLIFVTDENGTIIGDKVINSDINAFIDIINAVTGSTMAGPQPTFMNGDMMVWEIK